MKTKLMSLSLAIMIAVAGFSVNAQDNEKKKMHKKGKTEMVRAKEGKSEIKKDKPRMNRAQFIFAGIDLTPEQKAQIDSIRKNEKADYDKLKKDRKEDKKKSAEERKAQSKERMQQFDAQVKQILTPEQYAIFQQNLEKMKSEKNNHEKRKKDHKKGQKNCDKKEKCKKEGKTESCCKQKGEE